ncbi:hypothetical protein K227x_56020 [Rubripirellula lacrimiformis]|uniref:GTPase-associated protein 1 N-terminal domain-containing protein n=1 Tax=Rubripirellula lacrimiformis TaxID=1930273 RepID=A0A517NJ60_9BACT|nr:hypothetical protein [Rubripirellula lacrimiformis]QDT07177.1 hypothetical protein K227x_56020 [Rubripirellula lacrimiformis]
MDTMNVDQAVFASSDRGTTKGYQLVSKSIGVDRAIGTALSHWAPTRLPSENVNHWSINAFPVSDDRFAISRTVVGGPEYSGRGGREVVTLFLLLSNEQFAFYEWDAIAVARTAIAMGMLRLPLQIEGDQLPQAMIPSRPIMNSMDLADGQPDEDVNESMLDDVIAILNDSRRVALIGLNDPILTATRLVARLPIQARQNFSFTTGLPPSVHRPFHAHFFSSEVTLKQHALEAQKVVCFHAQKKFEQYRSQVLVQQGSVGVPHGM